MTARPEIGMEASRVFNALCMGQTIKHTEYLLVSPHCLQNHVADRIDVEIEKAKAGQPAYIGLKVNSLTDKYLIDKLIEASQAGVKIEMIIRGICCLIAGIPGRQKILQFAALLDDIWNTPEFISSGLEIRQMFILPPQTG